MPKYSRRRRHHRRQKEKIVASDRFIPQVAVNPVSSTEKRNRKEEAVIWFGVHVSDRMR